MRPAARTVRPVGCPGYLADAEATAESERALLTEQRQGRPRCGLLQLTPIDTGAHTGTHTGTHTGAGTVPTNCVSGLASGRGVYL